MNFTEFIEKSKSTLCKEYTEKLDKAGSKKAMIDLCLDANGMPWTAEAVAKGELDVDSILTEFSPFLNGKYKRNQDGYTSVIYCRPPEDTIDISTTAALIIGFNGIIRVYRPCELYIVNSNVLIHSEGMPNVYAYNSDVKHPYESITLIENKRY